MVRSVVALSIAFVLLGTWLVVSVLFHLFAGVIHLIAAGVGIVFLALLASVSWLAYQGRRLL